MMVRLQNLNVELNWGKLEKPIRFIQDSVKIYPTVPNWKSEISLQEGLKFCKNF